MTVIDRKVDDHGAMQPVPACSEEIVRGPVFGVHIHYPVLAICSLLLLAVGLVFGQTVGYDFVNFDDGLYVYENPQISGGLSARESAGSSPIPMATTGTR